MPDGTTVRLDDGADLWTGSGPNRDAPGMVFLHGGPGMWDYLGPVAASADRWFHTHRYDRRGCGRSSPDTDYRLARFVADLEQLRRHLAHERWYVFGHSFGALLGLEYAATHPDRVAGLVHCSGLGIGWATHRSEYRRRCRRRLGPERVRRLEELGRRERTRDEEVEWRILSWLPDFADPSSAESFARRDAETPLPLNLTCNRALCAETDARSGTDERLRWSSVAVPVWVVHGRDDPRPSDGARELAELLPSASFHELPGAGHQPWRERPDLVAGILTDVAAHAAG